MTGESKYRTEPDSLVSEMLDIKRRLLALETNPRIGNTTIDRGTLRVKDASGDPRVEIGLLSDGTYGINVKETGQDEFHQVPYVFAETVEAFEGTSSTTYTDLATIGPTVTVPVRSTGRILVILATQIQWNGNAPATSFHHQGRATVDVTGANTISTATAELRLLPINTFTFTSPDNFAEAMINMSTSMTVFEGLNPGNTTLTAKYRASSVSSHTAEFGRRTLAVFAL